MVLKIFTKRKKGGERIATGLPWFDRYVEAKAFYTSKTGTTMHITSEDAETVINHHVDIETHGFEIRNDAGVIIERFVTAIKEEDL